MKADLVKLYSSCFNDSDSYIEYFFNNKYSRNNTLLYRDSCKIVSALFLVYKKIRLRERTIPCPYIVGACTYYEYRGQGIMNKLIYDSFARLRSRGTCIVGLYPFRHSFYERQGFVTINKMQSIKITQELNNYTYRPATLEDSAALSKFYNQSLCNYNSYLIRNKSDFTNKLQEVNSAPGKTMIIYDNNMIIGYIMYDDSEIIEAIGSGFGIIKELVGKEYSSYSEDGEQYVMLRIIDPIKLLSTIRYSKIINDEIRIRITDAFFPINNITIKLAIDIGKCSIENCNDYNYELSIEQLTMLVTGSYNLNNYNPPNKLKDIFPIQTLLIYDKY